jgi:hypothetical protein
MVANIPLVFYPSCFLSLSWLHPLPWQEPGAVYRCFEEPVRCPGGEPGSCAVGRDHREGNTVADYLRPRVTTFGRGVLFQQKMRPAKQGTATRISFEKGAYRSFGDADEDVSIVSNIF